MDDIAAAIDIGSNSDPRRGEPYHPANLIADRVRTALPPLDV
jgi:hypothetical protein